MPAVLGPATAWNVRMRSLATQGLAAASPTKAILARVPSGLINLSSPLETVRGAQNRCYAISRSQFLHAFFNPSPSGVIQNKVNHERRK